MQIEDTSEGKEKPVETAETPPKKEDSAPAEPPKGDEPAETDAPFSVGDAEIERAVKCGMSIADARAFKDKDAFDRICKMLEARGDDKKISKDSEDKPKDGEDDSADFDVPELTEDEEFDPKLVKLGSVVRKMGDALKAMREENKSLRAAIGKSEEDRAKAMKEEADKAAALEKRKSLHIAPPGGVRGQRREKTDDDIAAEVAGEIASKFNI